MYGQLRLHTTATIIPSYSPPPTHTQRLITSRSLTESYYRMTYSICDKAYNCVNYNTGLET
jgi:hypothetical protein